MRSARIGLLSFISCLTGCVVAPTGSDAIRPSQLRSPVFVVVPANQSLAQDDYATRVERHLLASGMRVAVRPTFKAVRIETAGSESQAAAIATGGGMGSGAALMQGDERVVDSFLAMSDTKAHYRINTYAANGTVELVDLSNQQVLSVFSPGELGGQPKEANPLLHGTLRVIGFPVTQLEIPEQPPLYATLVQPSPILTVVPSSDWFWETAYALSIERLLVRLGLHVVRPPAPHYREQSAALAKEAANVFPGDLQSKAVSAKKIESFWELEDTAANVILETSSYNNSVKIIDKASREVRSVVNVYSSSGLVGLSISDGADSIRALRDALIAVGVPVAEPPKRAVPARPLSKRGKSKKAT